MVLPDDPKEPHLFSMLPWMLLYHLLKPDEAELDCSLHQHQADDEDDGIFRTILIGCIVLNLLLEPLPLSHKKT